MNPEGRKAAPAQVFATKVEDGQVRSGCTACVCGGVDFGLGEKNVADREEGEFASHASEYARWVTYTH